MRESIEAFPLCWPAAWDRTAPSKRERARFFGTSMKSYGSGENSYSYRTKRTKTVDESRRYLREELARLGAREVIISTNMPTRLDGEIKGSAGEPSDPGVAVYFKLKGKDQCFPCDRWDRIADNLWAIGKSIEAIRGLGRWGSERMVDASFTGFKALPETTKIDWMKTLGLYGTHEIDGPSIRAAYKKQAMLHHPDKGGSEEAFREVKRAFDAALAELGE